MPRFLILLSSFIASDLVLKENVFTNVHGPLPLVDLEWLLLWRLSLSSTSCVDPT